MPTILEYVIKANASQALGTMNQLGLALEKHQHDLRGVEIAAQMQGRAGRYLLGVGGGLTAMYVMASRAAIGFDESIRMANTALKVSESNFAALKRSVLAVAMDPSITAMPKELGEGFYEVAGGEYAATQGAQDVLSAGARLAEAGRAQMGPTLEGLMRVMRAYKDAPGEAAAVADDMMTVVNRGLPHLEEWTGAMGEAAGISAKVGASREEMMAALLTMSDALSTDESATAWIRLMTSIHNPSKEFAAALESVGYNAEEGLKSIGGAANAVQLLGEYTGGSADKLAELGLDMRAFKALLLLTGTEGNRYNELMQDIASNSGEVSSSLKALEGPGQRWRKALQQMSIAAIQMGDAVTPVATGLADAVIAATSAWNSLPDAMKKGVAYLGMGAAALTTMAGAELVAGAGLKSLQANLTMATLAQQSFTAANLESALASGAATTAIAAQTGSLGANAGALAGAKGIFAAGGAMYPAVTAGALEAVVTLLPVAAAVGTWWYLHETMVTAALREMTEKRQTDRELLAEAEGKGRVVEFAGERVDMQRALAYKPTKETRRIEQALYQGNWQELYGPTAIPLPGGGAEGERRADLHREIARQVGERGEGWAGLSDEDKRGMILRGVKQVYGPDAYAWLAAGAAETGARRQTLDEEAMKIVGERREFLAQQEAQKAKEARAKELAPQLWEEEQAKQKRARELAPGLWGGNAQGYTTVVQNYINNRDEMRKVQDAALNQAFPE